MLGFWGPYKMLTIFSTPKPFRGHINVIQRNALKSWTLLHPDVEIILFGDDEGTAEVVREFGIRHEPRAERNEFGLKRVDYIFGRAQEIGRHATLCYVNCDIILTGDFRLAIETVRARYVRFLMIGRRWDTPITEPIEYSKDSWAEQVRKLAISANAQRDEWFIDYFAFSRGLYGGEIPPMGIGAIGWDNWLMWKALRMNSAVVDASQSVVAIHQNHDYAYHPGGKQGVWEGKEARRNTELAGGLRHFRNISNARRALVPGGRFQHTWVQRTKRSIHDLPSRMWYSLLKLTYASRHAVGLNRRGMTKLRMKFGK